MIDSSAIEVFLLCVPNSNLQLPSSSHRLALVLYLRDSRNVYVQGLSDFFSSWGAVRVPTVVPGHWYFL